MSEQSLHNQIMNLPCDVKRLTGTNKVAYQLGHRDARHAAAELAIRIDDPTQLRADMQMALKTIRPLASAMGAKSTLAWCNHMERKYQIANATPENASK